MDYQLQYFQENPDMHLRDSISKVKQIRQVIPQDIEARSLLDIACGAGLITTELVKILKPKYAEGIDISSRMIKKAKSLDTTRLVRWKKADILKHRIRKKFDIVFCIDILEHIKDDLLFLRRVSQLGRYIVIRTPLEDAFFSRFLRRAGIYDSWKDTENRYGHVHHYNEKVLSKKLKESGFVILKEDSAPMPRRSNFILEIFRLLFYPISIFSMNAMVRISGGFKIYLLEKKR